MGSLGIRTLTSAVLAAALAGPVMGAADAIAGNLTVSPSAVVSSGRAHVRMTVPGAGRLTLTIVHHGHSIGRRTLTPAGGGARTVGVPLTRAAQRELRDGNFSAGLRVTFTTAGGSHHTHAYGLRLKGAPA